MEPILYMAPLQGVTNHVYRNAYSKEFFGYDLAVAPFIRSCEIRKSTKNPLRDILPERNCDRLKLVPQVLSNDPRTFILITQAIADLGYKTVNWNLGCPLSKIRNKKRGSGLLSEPEFIVDFLSQVVPRIPVSLSLKLRLGNETSNDILKLLPMIEGFALKEIIVHPRVGKEMYSYPADIETFSRCLELTEHRLIYNGDINSVETFNALNRRLNGVYGWMIGRGGIVNPFLPEEIKNLRVSTDNEKRHRFYSFLESVFLAYQQELSGPRHLMDKMKENWQWWSRAFVGGKQLFYQVSRIRKPDKYRAMVDNFFQQSPKLLI